MAARAGEGVPVGTALRMSRVKTHRERDSEGGMENIA